MSVGPDPLAQARALVEATRIVAASAGRDLDAVLDALVEQTARLLGTPGVSLHLAVPGTTDFVIRRQNPLSAGSNARDVGVRTQLDAFVQEAIARRQPLLSTDFHADPRIDEEAKRAFPKVVATVTVPLFADGELVGALFAHWDHAHQAGDDELRTLEALGQHAAIAILSARLLEEAREARSELEAILDAAGDAILVVDTRGDLVRANNVARTWLSGRLGHMPSSLAGFRERARPAVAGADDEAAPELAVERALAGTAASEELVIEDVAGERRHVHVSAGPIRGQDGRAVAAVVVARDITVLRRSIADQARFDGAVKTARRITHELKNQLTLVVGYGELLSNMVQGSPSEMARRINKGATAAADTLDQLQGIIRYEETTFGGQVMLDLDASTEPRREP